LWDVLFLSYAAEGGQRRTAGVLAFFVGTATFAIPLVMAGGKLRWIAVFYAHETRYPHTVTVLSIGSRL
jgi:hypothetical protein